MYTYKIMPARVPPSYAKLLESPCPRYIYIYIYMLLLVLIKCRQNWPVLRASAIRLMSAQATSPRRVVESARTHDDRPIEPGRSRLGLRHSWGPFRPSILSIRENSHLETLGRRAAMESTSGMNQSARFVVGSHWITLGGVLLWRRRPESQVLARFVLGKHLI